MSYTITEAQAKKTETKEENILKKFPLKGLHEMFGIDWNRHQLIKKHKHTGAFTIKGLIKEFNLDTSSSNLIIISMEFTYNYYWKNCGERERSTIILEKNSDKYYLMNNYWAKKDIERYRKQEDTIAYVLVIPDSLRIPVKKHETSLWNLTRFECDENTRFIYKPSIDKLYLDGYKYNTWNYRRDIEEALDKSGYSIIRKRQNLQSQLKDMHEKRLKEVVSSAFNKENSELFNKIIEVKKELAEKILQANTETDMRNLADNLRIIMYIIERYENHIQKLQNINNQEASSYSKYNSIQEVTNEIKGMYTQLACVKID